MIRIVMAAMAIAWPAPEPARSPPSPIAFWIWPTLSEARLWEAGHRERLCIHRVPDGWATFGC